MLESIDLAVALALVATGALDAKSDLKKEPTLVTDEAGAVDARAVFEAARVAVFVGVVAASNVLPVWLDRDATG